MATEISLIVFAIFARVKLTGHGSCPSEYNTVRFIHCATTWQTKGPIVQCDVTSKFCVPYWFATSPLCTAKPVNVLTTMACALPLVVVVAGFIMTCFKINKKR
jgi:hypothetical protein